MAYYATYMPNELGELQKVVINAGVGFVLPYYGETAPPALWPATAAKSRVQHMTSCFRCSARKRARATARRHSIYQTLEGCFCAG